jgi:ATP-dependent Clp protease ATP-binding subunit ClpB
VVFHPLTREQIRAIAQIQLQELGARLKDRDMSISFSDAAIDALGELGFDPVYGARPLKREIRQAIENPIAVSILSGEFGPGDRIEVDVDEARQFSFAKQRPH